MAMEYAADITFRMSSRQMEIRLMTILRWKGKMSQSARCIYLIDGERYYFLLMNQILNGMEDSKIKMLLLEFMFIWLEVFVIIMYHFSNTAM